eukprot:TRINITY_DN3370_c0_g1_i1.p1 TRINITY_DN3370_c0_g1~~TRINITY_DN3370_c0_g1_i1.p1  ORF type:complete len:585 (+),score=115.06 TRINITY_DN3370_c0_g1_i1:127-1881(+)
MPHPFSTLFLFAIVLFCVGFINADGGIKNENVVRKIDLTTQFAKHNITITFKNEGTKGVNTYEVALLPTQIEHLSYITATSRGGSNLPITKGSKTFTVTFPKEIAAGSSATFNLFFVLTHTMSPFPTHISQFDHQFVKYSDNHFFYSPYQTATQETTVKLATSAVESNSELEPTTLRGDTLTYGPYTDVAPYSNSPMGVHFENNSPFITITSMTKEFEISHWGNLAVEQTTYLQHDGAVLKGSFSRYDYQRNPGSSPSAVVQLTEVLPSGATEVYYRDDIGNISTSTFTSTPQGLGFVITPRFPLFGGWKNNFYIGYNLPLHSYLFKSTSDSSLFVLNVTFAPNIANVVIDEYVVRVILPEGAKDIQVRTPFSVDKKGTDLIKTYLDTSGRPVVVVEKHNVFSEHNQFFQVEYRFSTLSMLQEPLLIVIFVFLLLTAFMFYMRFDVSISKETVVAKSGVFSQYTDIHYARNDLLHQLDELLSRFNVKTYAQEKKEIEARLATLSREVSTLIAEVDASIKQKIKNLEASLARKLEAHSRLHTHEVSFRTSGNPAKRSDYETQRANLHKDYTKISEELDTSVQLLE